MPYKVFKSGGMWCVHKLNPDGSKGKPVKGGCHPSKTAAARHARALYANVEDAAPK
jgi:hypothetical protein